MVTTPILADRMILALVARFLRSDTSNWRHHGIGLLQAYVLEGPIEYRVHVWHPELRFVDDDSGMIHDHRFEILKRHSEG